MKFVVIVSLFTLALACNAAPTESKKTLPVHKAETLVKDVKIKEAAGKKEEDCDEKAKKPIEIKADTISLTGNTGCTLDEAKSAP